ncbi:nuclear transport factor 2 family protein [Streptomyces sp. TX20-6-3]|uniref:nuclear transport factor 2 family protein n=1 Tax=Streptomyces sp. TX20-6-3 TaxID=3028705 RepID=UPI0029BB77C7|nr:nuclear transport factor 2 family protein [Streptomyces sp. TX20-6-3]MDX2565325.1 nuclear transport factor 2 family protein [Streptomyces sp. TX20-6-3]
MESESRNAKSIRNVWESFNDRNWDAMVASFSTDMVFVDGGLGTTGGLREFIDHEKRIANSFPGITVTHVEIIDGDSVVISRIWNEAASWGELGEFLLADEVSRAAVQCCVIWHFNEEKVVRCEGFLIKNP